jgi:enoyl-CoA hydratase/carnithine racemase
MIRGWQLSLGEALDYEAMVQEAAAQTDDNREGIMAFLEKRQPEFQGK